MRSYQDQVELAANADADRAGIASSVPVQGPRPRWRPRLDTLPTKAAIAFDLQATDASRQAELESLAPSVGLTTISGDPHHFQLASMSMPARPGTPQAANPSNPIYEGLVARGYSPVQAYALMGNMQQESNFSPGANNQKEGAYGLLQWRQDRRANLESFAALARQAGQRSQHPTGFHSLRADQGLGSRKFRCLSRVQRCRLGQCRVEENTFVMATTAKARDSSIPRRSPAARSRLLAQPEARHKPAATGKVFWGLNLRQMTRILARC